MLYELCYIKLCQNDANGKGNSGDPDQTAPLGAQWSS